MAGTCEETPRRWKTWSKSSSCSSSCTGTLRSKGERSSQRSGSGLPRSLPTCVSAPAAPRAPRLRAASERNRSRGSAGTEGSAAAQPARVWNEPLSITSGTGWGLRTAALGASTGSGAQRASRKANTRPAAILGVRTAPGGNAGRARVPGSALLFSQRRTEEGLSWATERAEWHSRIPYRHSLQ